MEYQNLNDKNLQDNLGEGMKKDGDSIYGYAIAALVGIGSLITGSIIKVLEIRSKDKAHNNISDNK